MRDLTKVKLNVIGDEDGYTLTAFNYDTKLKKEWRFDMRKGNPDQYVKYRSDLKPNTRTHEVIEALYGFDEWLDVHADEFAEMVTQ